MRKIASLVRLLRELLNELSDQNAYARHLRATGRLPSGEEWRRFADGRYRRKYRNAKCC